jgi:hypothetical protein
MDVMKLWFALVVRQTHRRPVADAAPAGERTRV